VAARGLTAETLQKFLRVPVSARIAADRVFPRGKTPPRGRAIVPQDFRRTHAATHP
jgi:hypothetical protein